MGLLNASEEHDSWSYPTATLTFLHVKIKYELLSLNKRKQLYFCWQEFVFMLLVFPAAIR